MRLTVYHLNYSAAGRAAPRLTAAPASVTRHLLRIPAALARGLRQSAGGTGDGTH